MANRDAPLGLRVHRRLDGGTSYSINEYSVDTGVTTGIFIGDPVKIEADGNVAPCGTGTTPCVGVVVGVKGRYDNLEQRYLPASTAGTVMVVDDPFVTFAIQGDGAVDPLEDADKGANASFIAGSGSTTTGLSAYEIDSTSHNTTAALPIKLLRPIPRADNTNDSANVEWEVMINNHQLRNTTGT